MVILLKFQVLCDFILARGFTYFLREGKRKDHWNSITYSVNTRRWRIKKYHFFGFGSVRLENEIHSIFWAVGEKMYPNESISFVCDTLFSIERTFVHERSLWNQSSFLLYYSNFNEARSKIDTKPYGWIVSRGKREITFFYNEHSIRRQISIYVTNFIILT